MIAGNLHLFWGRRLTAYTRPRVSVPLIARLAAIGVEYAAEQPENDVEKKELFEFRDAGYVLRVEPVTKADKLNGREWHVELK
ncbi:MAG: hypothetical protein LC776_16775 [Acidobacteria bacterium]|nr:hypothetical protein [Acidobacteriota bacterium]